MADIVMRRVAQLQPHARASLVPSMQAQEYADLLEDIRRHGIQVPLDISGNTVLDGRHRLLIARELDLRIIPCRQVSLDGESSVVYMLKMALLRRHLTDDQRAATAALWKKHEARAPGRPPRNSHNGVDISKASAAAAPTLFNVARRKVDEATYLLHRSPRRLTAVHQGTLKLKEALRDVAFEEQKRNIAALRAPRGQFSVIVVDPPWPYEKRTGDVTKRGAIPYPAMSVAKIERLHIPAAGDCLLWLWTTNAFMHEAFHVLEAWGFEPKTILTWVKNKIGTGDWLRGQTEHCILGSRGDPEHCILAVKGRPLVDLKNQSTVLYGTVREHSRKPDTFFALIESLCPAPDKLEMFARCHRPGWQRWG